MICIIDYGVGNLFSLKSSLAHLGLEAKVSADAADIRAADRLILPGVAITASGGISSEKELLELEEMGTAAAILGKSLYTGALDLGRCVALVQK